MVIQKLFILLQLIIHVRQYFPKEVNRKYFCSGSKINTDSVKEIDGRLVIGYLHNATTCSSDKIFQIDNDRITGNYVQLETIFQL